MAEKRIYCIYRMDRVGRLEKFHTVKRAFRHPTLDEAKAYIDWYLKQPHNKRWAPGAQCIIMNKETNEIVSIFKKGQYHDI